MTENTDRAELLERARKLFAVSSDKSSPEEAGIAARKLRKLMDDNAVSLSEFKEVRPCCADRCVDRKS